MIGWGPRVSVPRPWGTLFCGTWAGEQVIWPLLTDEPVSARVARQRGPVGVTGSPRHPDAARAAAATLAALAPGLSLRLAITAPTRGADTGPAEAAAAIRAVLAHLGLPVRALRGAGLPDTWGLLLDGPCLWNPVTHMAIRVRRVLPPLGLMRFLAPDTPQAPSAGPEALRLILDSLSLRRGHLFAQALTEVTLASAGADGPAADLLDWGKRTGALGVVGQGRALCLLYPPGERPDAVTPGPFPAFGPAQLVTRWER